MYHVHREENLIFYASVWSSCKFGLLVYPKQNQEIIDGLTYRVSPGILLIATVCAAILLANGVINICT